MFSRLTRAAALSGVVFTLACSEDAGVPMSPSESEVLAAGPGGTIVVVTPNTMNGGCQTLAAPVICYSTYPTGWLFYNDLGDAGDPTLGSFVIGPDAPAYGVGSVQISTSGLQRPSLATYAFAGTPLASITALSFRTYNPSAGNGGPANRSAYLNFNVDFNGSDTFQRRLVFVPSVNGTVVQNAWKEWDAINGGNALWSYSGPTWPITGQPGTTAKTWSQILADYPGIRMRVTDAFTGLRVGEPYADGYTENIDSFTFGTAAGTTTWDFDPYAVVGDAAACKDGGWVNVKRADGSSFKNQGDCVSYVKNGR
jgi:hypothetical protein